MTVLTWPTAAFDSVVYEHAAWKIMCQSSFWENGAQDITRSWMQARLNTNSGKRSTTFESTGEEAEVEKRALVRFALFSALWDKRVTLREVSIVLGRDGKTTTKTRSRSGKRCG
jgi:hypothetical protein